MTVDALRLGCAVLRLRMRRTLAGCRVLLVHLLYLMSARSLIYLLSEVWFANRGFACDEIKCGKGFCIQRDDEVYRCVCMSGYEGENCDRRTFDRRFAPDEDGNVTCDPTLCENGGTRSWTERQKWRQERQKSVQDVMWKGTATHVYVPLDSLEPNVQRRQVTTCI